MTITVSTMDMRQRLGDILNRVELRNDEYVIERKGKPMAALVPVARLQQMRKAARELVLGELARPVAPISQRAAESLADEAKHRSRKARR